jgi:hypothetical protein
MAVDVSTFRRLCCETYPCKLQRTVGLTFMSRNDPGRASCKGAAEAVVHSLRPEVTLGWIAGEPEWIRPRHALHRKAS